jgi:hypothetical protein
MAAEDVRQFRCLRCRYFFKIVQPPKPWYGEGYDADGNMTDDEDKWVPNMPITPSCPNCGHLYVERTFEKRRKRKKKART